MCIKPKEVQCHTRMKDHIMFDDAHRETKMNQIGFFQQSLFKLAFPESGYTLLFYNHPMYQKSWYIYSCVSTKRPPERFHAQKDKENGLFYWKAVFLAADVPPTCDIVRGQMLEIFVSVASPLHLPYALVGPSLLL